MPSGDKHEMEQWTGEWDSARDPLNLPYCSCADPENCREPIPGYECRPRKPASPPPPDAQLDLEPIQRLLEGPVSWPDLDHIARLLLAEVERLRAEKTLDDAALRDVCGELRTAHSRIKDAEAEVARLRQAIDYADEVIHGEFCGHQHNDVCDEFRKLAGPSPVPEK